jgi:hypothetical protein
MLDRAVWCGSLGLIAVALIGATSLQAQSVIATYDISTANGFTTPTVTPTTASGVTAGNLGVSGVSPGSNLGGSYIWRVWGASTSRDLTRFMEWSVGPTAGNQIDFTGANATFSLVFGSSGGTHGADTWELHASTDGFVSVDTPLGSPMGLTTSLQQVPESVPLGVLATQIGTVTFRLYGYNDTTQSPSADSAGLMNRAPGTLGITGTGGNLLISGTVSAVPEPSSYAAVFGALAFGFVFITRRLRNA